MRILLVLLLLSTNVFAQTKYLPSVGPISFSATKKAFFESDNKFVSQHTLTNVNGVETNQYHVAYFNSKKNNTTIILAKDDFIVRIFMVEQLIESNGYDKNGIHYDYYKFKYRDLFTKEVREMEQLRGIENQDTTLMLHDIYYNNYYFKN